MRILNLPSMIQREPATSAKANMACHWERSLSSMPHVFQVADASCEITWSNQVRLELSPVAVGESGAQPNAGHVETDFSKIHIHRYDDISCHYWFPYHQLFLNMAPEMYKTLEDIKGRSFYYRNKCYKITFILHLDLIHTYIYIYKGNIVSFYS